MSDQNLVLTRCTCAVQVGTISLTHTHFSCDDPTVCAQASLQVFKLLPKKRQAALFNI